MAIDEFTLTPPAPEEEETPSLARRAGMATRDLIGAGVHRAGRTGQAARVAFNLSQVPFKVAAHHAGQFTRGVLGLSDPRQQRTPTVAAATAPAERTPAAGGSARPAAPEAPASPATASPLPPTVRHASLLSRGLDPLPRRGPEYTGEFAAEPGSKGQTKPGEARPMELTPPQLNMEAFRKSPFGAYAQFAQDAQAFRTQQAKKTAKRKGRERRAAAKTQARELGLREREVAAKEKKASRAAIKRRIFDPRTGFVTGEEPVVVNLDTGELIGQPTQQLSYPLTQEDFDTLPAGALYVDPEDGQTYQKPAAQQ